jgi:hypothetical protein
MESKNPNVHLASLKFPHHKAKQYKTKKKKKKE